MELESLIKKYIILPLSSNSGWHSVIGQCCADYKPRGAFKFDNGSVYYNCFNCNVKIIYKGGFKLSNKFKKLLISFGVPESEIDRCVNLSFFNEKKTVTSVDPIKKHLELPTI